MAAGVPHPASAKKTTAMLFLPSGKLKIKPADKRKSGSAVYAYLKWKTLLNKDRHGFKAMATIPGSADE